MRKALVLGLIFLTGLLAQEYEPYDGFYNNPAHPEWGGEDSVMLRRLPAHYADGVGEPIGDRPNPRALSEATQKGNSGMGSYLNRTALLVFFGQQVVEEILDAQDPGCPTEYINIDVPKCDYLYDPNCTGIAQIPLFRNRYSRLTGQAPGIPRAMLNDITPWFDGGLMYGKSKAWADSLRSFEGGELASEPGTNGRFPRVNRAGIPLANPPPPRDHYLKSVKRFFQIGNPRGNENPMLLTMGIMWFRNHNWHARQLAAQHPDWDDDELFNRARQWTIAEHQHIVLNRWLPAWINATVPAYTGWNPALNPQIVLEFQSAAMRYGHTMVTPGIYRRDAQCNFRNTTIQTKFEGHIGLRTCNTFWNPQEAIRESDIDEILMGLASQIAEREDNIITEDLRGFVFGPLEGNRRDLMAINVQRGRDNGLQDYNSIRELYGLPRLERFEDLNPDYLPLETRQAMRDLYNNDTNNIDLWVGGILETTPAGPGPLFRAILLEQFTRIRAADRFWYANRANKIFTDEEIATIENTELSDIIYRVTNIPFGAIQRDVFHHYQGDPCPQPKQLSQFDMENCTLPMTYDYYSISTSHIPWIVCSLVAWIGICVGIVIVTVRCKYRFLPKKAEIPVKVPENRTFEKMTLYGAVELNENQDALRPVYLELQKKKLTLRNMKDNVLRDIFFDRISAIQRTEKLSDLLLIKVPLEHDLLLQFKDEMAKMDFAEPLLKLVSKPVSVVTDKIFFSQMKTKAMRKKELEGFFKRTLESVFSNKKASTKELSVEEITLDEFAEVFSLPRNSLFVTQLFDYADSDKNGTVSSNELVKLLAVFYKQDPKEKIRFMFDLYDKNGSGSVDKQEFTNMIKSMLEINNQDIPSDEGVSDVVMSMYEAAGLKDGSDIRFEDFQRMTEGFHDIFELVKVRPDAPAAPSADRNKKLSRAATVILSKSPNRQATKRQLKKNETVRSFQPAEKENTKPSRIFAFLANYRLQIFWLTLYYLTISAIFAERFYTYAFEREHRGLRRIAGWGIATTRGAASSMMFIFAFLLLTMCKNLITLLRETPIKHLIPFDNAFEFHIISALTGFLMVAVHCIGHFVNFFSIATEPTTSLACLFREVNWVTDYLPSFYWWFFRTPTGVTGYVAVLVILALGIFSISYFRQSFFTPFIILHQVLAFMFYALSLMHGWAQLVQIPIFHTYLIGPLFLYTIDKLMSVAQLGHNLKVRKVEWLPSEVLHLRFDRPPNFNYKAGQYLQLASYGISGSLFHPFTITSAPHEPYLSLHIRAVGPWTNKLRQIYNPNATKYPELIVTGPYGSEADTWSTCSHVIMVGAGIGVTPFASILKDFVFRSKNDKTFKTRKLIFFWVCKTQKHFEWLVDIIREAEFEDTKGRLEVHIFVTELQQKFDLRTVMLYICEKQFYKVHNTSLFTGLQAATHFGRPNFPDLFTQIQAASPKADKLVVFSCVPKAMLKNVEKACDIVNTHSGPKFYHSADGFF